MLEDLSFRVVIKIRRRIRYVSNCKEKNIGG